jgi:cell division control protein 6
MGYFDSLQGRAIIKDKKALAFSYIPKELPHRGAQMTRLFTMFRSVAEEGVSQNALLRGRVGTGKTVLAKRFCQDFKEWAGRQHAAVEFKVVNCRRRASNTSVLLELVTHFDENFPDRGFSNPEMLDIIRKNLIKDRIHFVVVLDEVDVLLRKAGPDLIYQLTRFEEESLKSQGSISLILVSQENVLELMDEASRSTFKRTSMIEFDRYTREELHDIVAQRVGLAFAPDTVDEEVIAQVAAIAAETGDARRAIELLEKSGMLAEEEGASAVAAEHVRKANALAYSQLDAGRLDDLDRQRQLALLGVARALKRKSSTTTGEATGYYETACEEFGEKPRGTTQFWKYIRDLSDRGIIETERTRSGTEGLTTLITLTEASAVELEEELARRLASGE